MKQTTCPLQCISMRSFNEERRRALSFKLFVFILINWELNKEKKKTIETVECLNDTFKVQTLRTSLLIDHLY